MKKKFIVIFGLVCLAVFLFFVFKNDNVQVAHDKNIASVSNNTASASNSTVPKTKTMYRILEFNGDTTVWDSADCVIRDSSFSCRKTCKHDFFEKLFGTKWQKTDTNHKKKQKVIYKDSNNYKDLNFGKDAIVNYIPIADIPAFDRNNVANFFSYISGGPCSKLLTFSSNYKIEAIGIPDDFKWMKRNAHEMLIHKNAAGQNTCKLEQNIYKSLQNLLSKPPKELKLIHSTNKKIAYQPRLDVNFCYLPEKKEIYEYQLLNYSLLYKDTTFSWKLVYRDQYGRGDTLDITTKFEATPNYTPAKCYDSANEIGSTEDTLFYRILDFRGDTTIWLPSDCKIFGNRFSCVRRVSASKWKQCNYPYHKDNSSKAKYKNLNFGKEAITNYIPTAEIPEFNRDSVAKVFSTLPSTSCSALLTFKSNYSIEPIGLPKDFEWRKDFPKAVVKEISKKKKLCALEYRSASNRPVPYKQYRDIIFEELPEKARVYNYQLFNKSLQSYKDSTIKWKLVYKDQYGRGDTLDITTKFE